MSFAIIRTAKLKTFGNLGGSGQHNFRERETLNADASRTPNNKTSGAQNSMQLIAAAKGIISKQEKIRKNAVIAVEYFIGASPEWFRDNPKSLHESYFDAAEKWLKDRHGADNVLSFTRQYDETSPHVCAYVVPIDPKGKLNASHYLDGKVKLSEMQTNFTEKVGKRFGLERGIEGSAATHTTIKEYYGHLAKPIFETVPPIPPVPVPTKKDHLGALFGMETEHDSAVVAYSAAVKKRDSQISNIHRRLKAKAIQHDVDRKNKEARERKLKQMRENSVQLREIPLTDVLERLGYTRDPADKNNWITASGRMTVKGQKFFCHDEGKGGGGAIDLMMQLECIDFKTAIQRLSNMYGTGASLEVAVTHYKSAIKDIVEKPLEFAMPARSQQKWPRVREYLVRERRISERLVDLLHKQDLVYADANANCVFPLGELERPVGCELRGTGARPFHGVRGQKASYSLNNIGATKQVAFVESAIDAISLIDLGKFFGVIVSMAGNAAELLKEKVKYYRERGYKIIAAFDADSAGDKMSNSIAADERMRPVNGKDWNDELKYSKPTFDELEARRQAEIASFEQARQELEIDRDRDDYDDLSRDL